MAVDMFLKIQGIDGESTDDKHKNEIDVLSFSWGISNTSKQSAPGRLSPARKASLTDFSIVKKVDKASPELFVSSCEGAHFPEVSFTARKAGGQQQDYYKVTLKEVFISSVAPGGSAGSSQDAFEQVSFAFASAEISAAGPDGQFNSRAVCGGSLAEEPPPVIIESVKKD
jgi:type VI secretion system secreted protein Hcp